MKTEYIVPPTRRSRRFSRLKFWAWFGIFSILALAAEGVWFVKNAEFFRIKSLTAAGLTEHQQALALELFRNGLLAKSPVARFLGTDNFLAWPRKIEDFPPEFASIEIDKNFLNRTVSVTFTSRERWSVWCQEDGTACFWIDRSEGIVMEEAAFAEGQLVFRLLEARDKPPVLGSHILPPPLFKNAAHILEGVRHLKIPVKEITLERQLQELRVRLRDGAVIMFSLRFEPNEYAFAALQKLLKGNPPGTVNYIDLTVENKAYLKKR